MPSASRKVVRAWAMYDWANSVYNLVITATFFPIYFESVTRSPNGDQYINVFGLRLINSSLYNYVLSASYLMVALSYPVLTSVADNRGSKKFFLKLFCYVGALGCSSLFFFKGLDTLWIGIAGLMCGAMGYVGSLVFYNAYLPEIAAPEDRDAVSAKGYAYGYVGSVVLQLIGFGLVLSLPQHKALASRITFLLVGVWWFGFAQLSFAGLPKTPRSSLNRVNVFADGFAKIKKVWLETRKMPVLKRFLRAFFFYSMGVQAIMLAATMFGAKALGLPQTNLIATIVIIQLLAVAGAIGMSRLSARFGNLQVLMAVVVLWIVCCAVAIKAANMATSFTADRKAIQAVEAQKLQNPKASASELAAYAQQIEALNTQLVPKRKPVEYLFYGIAVGIGLVMGGIQSLSRSTYSKLMPETQETASYFGYYDFTEKIAIVIGIFSFGFIHQITGSMSNSILVLIGFFAIGFVALGLALRMQKRLATGKKSL